MKMVEHPWDKWGDKFANIRWQIDIIRKELDKLEKMEKELFSQTLTDFLNEDDDFRDDEGIEIIYHEPSSLN